MKKKLLFSIIFVILLGLSLFSVKAYSGEIDPNNYITMPMGLIMFGADGKATCTVSLSNTISDYSISYQVIDMSESSFSNYKDKVDAYNAKVKEINSTLQDKVDNVNALSQEYNDLVSQNASEEQKQSAKSRYDTAKNDYDAYVESSKVEIETYRTTMLSTLPDFNDGSWISTTKTSENVTIDYSGRTSNKIYFVLWVKASNGGTSYYDFIVASSEFNDSPSTTPDPEPGTSDGSDWTDFSNLTVTFNNDNHMQYEFTVGGFTLKPDHFYQFYLTKDSNAPVKNSDGTYSSNAVLYLDDSIENRQFDATQYFALDGDVYLHVLEHYGSYTGSNEKFVVTGYKINRPNLLSLGSRMKFYFFNDWTSSFLFELYDTSRILNIKIGKVTDIDILRAIQRGDSDCLSRLLEYAKTADAIYTGSVPLGRSEAIANNLNLVNDEYYFVYSSIDTGDGVYYPIEDVSLYQAVATSLSGNNLYDYLSDEFKWNLGNDNGGVGVEPGKDPTVVPDSKMPQTGENFIVLGLVIAVISSIGFMVKSKKYNLK